MTILIRRARIVDAASPFNDSVQDILIHNGIIEQIANDIESPADEVISIEGLHLSPGWVDTFTHCCDPGFEFRETLETGSRAAATGGFTHIFVLPNTQPVLQNKSMIEYVRDKNISVPVSLHPIGAITRNAEGKELAEMYDMQASGAVAFSDGIHPLQSAGIMIKALQYVKAFNGVVIQVPDDTSISPQGLMNEGIVSTRLGLPGKPAMAEELMVARDIKLTRYASSRLHFTGISSPKSIEYIGRAKESGIDITCSVTPYHLFFSEEDLETYDTNLKVNLPLRTPGDIFALKAAVLEGKVDCISSHHIPQDTDHKVCEFEYAKAGMIGLESVFGVLGAIGIPVNKIIELISENPRKIFSLNSATIETGNEADITLFLPGVKYIFSVSDINSKSKNSAFVGKELTGKVAGIIHGKKMVLHIQ
jgi:dihydroorotase